MQHRFASLCLIALSAGCAVAESIPDARRPDSGVVSDTGVNPPRDAAPPMDSGVVSMPDVVTAPMCDGGQTLCTGRCVSTSSDGLNCGACGNACPAGQVCNSGSCQADCAMGTTRCGAACADVQTDPAHCGRCGNACPAAANATATCAAGACGVRCAAGFADCDGNPANGCETDTTSSVAHCGRCANACAAANGTPACSAGACSFMCNAGFGDCDSNAANGCEVNTNTTLAHCGRCGNACGAPSGGTATCAAGTCGGTCPAGQTVCSGACVDTQTSATNCGACGTTCPAGQSCSAGRCGAALPTRYTQTSSTQAFLNACTGGVGRQTVLSSVDDSTAALTVPFAFRFWNRNITAGATAYVSSNGNLQLIGTGVTSLSGTIPSSSDPDAVIAPYWRDLLTSASGVCSATFGTAPNRQWVIQWQTARHYSTETETLTFEIVITETSNTIDLVYSTMSGASVATVGTENDDGSLGIGGCAAMAASCTPAANSRTRFVPAP
jgi:Stigma-specific protein, Stig1